MFSTMNNKKHETNNRKPETEFAIKRKAMHGVSKFLYEDTSESDDQEEWTRRRKSDNQQQQHKYHYPKKKEIKRWHEKFNDATESTHAVHSIPGVHHHFQESLMKDSYVEPPFCEDVKSSSIAHKLYPTKYSKINNNFVSGDYYSDYYAKHVHKQQSNKRKKEEDEDDDDDNDSENDDNQRIVKNMNALIKQKFKDESKNAKIKKLRRANKQLKHEMEDQKTALQKVKKKLKFIGKAGKDKIGFIICLVLVAIVFVFILHMLIQTKKINTQLDVMNQSYNKLKESVILISQIHDANLSSQ